MRLSFAGKLKQVGRRPTLSVLANAGSASTVGHELDQFLAGIINTPNTNAYDQAIDSVYLSTGVGGSRLHHLVDGHHDVLGAFSAAQRALPNDSFGAEVLGTAGHLAKDLFSVMGLPLISVSPERFVSWSAWVQRELGISKTWQADFMQLNGMEVLGGALCGAALLAGMNRADTRALSEIAAGTGLSGLIGANPLVLLVAGVALVAAWKLKREGESWTPEIRHATIAALTTGAMIGMGSLLAVPASGGILPLMAAIALTLLTGFAVRKYLFSQVGRFTFDDFSTWERLKVTDNLQFLERMLVTCGNRRSRNFKCVRNQTLRGTT
jgi:hypothetical protein